MPDGYLSGKDITSHMLTCASIAAAVSFDIVVSPMPRAGKFITRRSASSSFGFIAKRKYAIASLTSFR